MGKQKKRTTFDLDGHVTARFHSVYDHRLANRLRPCVCCVDYLVVLFGLKRSLVGGWGRCVCVYHVTKRDLSRLARGEKYQKFRIYQPKEKKRMESLCKKKTMSV